MTVTIYDVAREAGVSMATVSRVVNANPNVKPTTRKKVLDAIERLGYRPNAVARGLASKKTTTVGVVIPDISGEFFSEVARGIDDIANMYNYNIILCNSDTQKEKELRLIDTLFEKQVDGLLFMGAEVTADHKEAFRTSHVPVVLSATYDDESRFPSVNIDNKQGAADATALLLDEGHERVALITGPLTDPVNGYPRYQGYRDALEAKGVAFDERYVRVGDYRYNSGMEAMKEFLAMDNPPTAVFAASDKMAVGAIHAVQDAGKRVPEDVSIIGFDNIDIASMVRPLLSTIGQPMYDIGAVSMRLLTKLMNEEDVEDPHVVLQHDVVLRESTKTRSEA